MCGGDLSEAQLVSEQYLLDLEREAFLSLCGEKKSLERIQSVLKGGKPVRNKFKSNIFTQVYKP
mgnify:FL=1